MHLKMGKIKLVGELRMSGNADTTPRQAAQRLGVRLMYVYGLLWTGELPGRKRDGRWVIPTGAVDADIFVLQDECRSLHSNSRVLQEHRHLSGMG